MDRLVKSDVNEVELRFQKRQKCSASFKLTNLMHTMSVAVSITTTNSSVFSFDKSYYTIPPLSFLSFKLQLSEPYEEPPISIPPDLVTVRSTMLPTGKAHQDELRSIFAKPGPHVFRDAVIEISFVGPQVADFLISHHTQLAEAHVGSFFKKAISGCTGFEITKLLRPAVVSGVRSFVKSLVDAGGDVNFLDSDGRFLISLAVRTGDIDILKFLMASGCEINDTEVDLVLHEAAKMNRVDLMEVLFTGLGDVDLNLTDSDGRSPFHIAALHGHVKVIEFCVSVGGDPNVVDCEGWTPLHCAASEGHLDAVNCLLDCSNVKYVLNKDGKMAFSLALDNGHSHLLDLLYLGDMLHRAARVDDIHAMKSCLAIGAMVNGRDQNGWTPLHRASFKGRIKSVKLLLDHGAQVDAVDDTGYTPLHCAAEAGHVQVALLLIAHGAQVLVKSLKGVIAIAPTINTEGLKSHPTIVSQTSLRNDRCD